jgi:hypothetical protein
MDGWLLSLKSVWIVRSDEGEGSGAGEGALTKGKNSRRQARCSSLDQKLEA